MISNSPHPVSSSSNGNRSTSATRQRAVSARPAPPSQARACASPRFGLSKLLCSWNTTLRTAYDRSSPFGPRTYAARVARTALSIHAQAGAATNAHLTTCESADHPRAVPATTPRCPSQWASTPGGQRVLSGMQGTRSRAALTRTPTLRGTSANARAGAPASVMARSWHALIMKETSKERTAWRSVIGRNSPNGRAPCWRPGGAKKAPSFRVLMVNPAR